MTESQHLRKLITDLYEASIKSYFDGTISAVEDVTRHHELIVETSNAAEAIPRDCECGERMTRMKKTWHCDGCGRSREL